MLSETADIETASDDYATRFSGPAGEFFLNRQTKLTLDILKNRPKARVLDIGGGHAQLATPLVENGYDVTVTGSDDSCEARLKQSIPSGNYTYITCNSLHLPFEDQSFDVVLSFRLLPHITEWQQLISEMCRISKQCVVFDYPDKRSSNIMSKQLFSIKKKIEKNTRPFMLFSRSEVATELTKHEFLWPEFRPEFFLPMVIHRKLQNKTISSAMEAFFGATAMTKMLGSPIIVHGTRKD